MGELRKYYDWGEFKMSVSGFDLERNGRRINDLTITALTLLKILLASAAASSVALTISKDELIKAVWGEDTSVGDTSLTHYIHRIRHVLEPGVSVSESCIQTVPGYGYRFRLDVRVLDHPEESRAEGESLRAERGPNEGILVSGVSDVSPSLKRAVLDSGIMDELGRVYLAQHQESHCQYLRCGVVVQARCLLTEGEPEFSLSDLVNYRADFKTLGDRVYCRCLSITGGTDRQPPEMMSCTVYNLRSGKGIRTFPIPIRSQQLENIREWLVYFDPVLAPRSGPYRLDCQYAVEGFMQPLKDRGRDKLEFNLRRSPGQKVRVDFVVGVPKRFASARMAPRNLPRPGRAMTEVELLEYGPSSPSFRLLGWTDIEPREGQNYAVDIRLR
jgi:DNA-binding winged helix-turn-helix (wHTH) protein